MAPSPPHHILLHTHWDREWYDTATTYQMRLLPVMREILSALENDTIPHVHLDGQTVILDDYCQWMPEDRPRIQRLVAEKKLSLGPWYVMPDEWLVSGESLRQNLRLGLHQAQTWGMSLAGMVGYLPDTFGHTGDMPDLLLAHGIRRAAVWRGLREDGPAVFWWQSHAESPQRVLCLRLTGGYFQPYLHAAHWCEGSTGWPDTVPLFQPDAPPQTPLPEDLTTFVTHIQTALPEGVPALLPVGGDHLGLPNHTALHAALTQLPAQITSLTAYFDALEAALTRHGLYDTLPVIVGPLMQGPAGFTPDTPNAPFLLTGVWSARVGLKQANRRLERALSHRLPPLLNWLHKSPLAHHAPTGSRFLPSSVLDTLYHTAWRTLLLNHPHDSICGCSLDAVHQENQTRFQQVADLAEELTRQTLGRLASTTPPGEPLVLNLTATPLQHRVVWLPTHTLKTAHLDTPDATQPGTHLARPDATLTHAVPLSHRWVLTEHHPTWLAGPLAPLHPGTPPAPPTLADTLPPEVRPQASGLHLQSPLWTAQASLDPTDAPLVLTPATPPTSTVVVSLLAWHDPGDSYNRGFSPLPPVRYRLTEVHAHQHASGATAWLDTRWDAPPDDPLTATAPLPPITLTVRAEAGSPVLALHTQFVNTALDVRFQLLLTPTTSAPAEPAPTVVWLETHGACLTPWTALVQPKAPLTAPVPAWREWLPATFPLQTVMAWQQLGVIVDGISEGEWLANDHTLGHAHGLAFTLHRAFGWLSKPDTGTRGANAGPQLRTPGGQELGQTLTSTLGLIALPQPTTAQTATSHLQALSQEALLFLGDGLITSTGLQPVVARA